MASRGHSEKKKKNTFNNPKEELKEPKGDEAMDGQPNTIRNLTAEEQAIRTALFANPFA